MSKRKGGIRRKTRGKLSRANGTKGKLSLRNYLTEYKIGDKVILKMDPICAEGLFHSRFYGKIGTVDKKRGACYEVKIKDFNAKKTIIVHPVHLIKSE